MNNPRQQIDKRIEELRKEAKEILEKNGIDFALRSCWNCNGAHKHLKEVDYIINCFECGKWFYKGVDISEND